MSTVKRKAKTGAYIDIISISRKTKKNAADQAAFFFLKIDISGSLVQGLVSHIHNTGSLVQGLVNSSNSSYTKHYIDNSFKMQLTVEKSLIIN